MVIRKETQIQSPRKHIGGRCLLARLILRDCIENTNGKCFMQAIRIVDIRRLRIFRSCASYRSATAVSIKLQHRYV